MNPIAEEMNDILMHYGTPRHSGRYPWGSGEDPYQKNIDILGRINELKKQGWSETPENIKKEFGVSTGEYRTIKARAISERRLIQVDKARSLKEDGLGYTEIGRQMGINESTVRSLLNTESEAKNKAAQKTADFLKDQVDSKGMIDIGVGVERELNISREKLNQAVSILKEQGYVAIGCKVEQVTNRGNWTNVRVIAPPGTQQKEIYNWDQIHSATEYISHDGGDTFDKFIYPKSMDSNRLMIRYAEDGGIKKDGIVELRRGVDDLSLGEKRYSQVRILVDDKKYIKGMAIYSDDMPPGVDVIFNTNKTKNVSKLDVLKDIKDDPDNPFGSAIKTPGGQSYYIDKNGKKQLSLINKRADEGDWTEWKDSLPSQFLSKQSESMAKKQLSLAIADKKAEYDDIRSLTNPTVKKHFLEKFSDECDAAAVHLQAASLPGQKYHVIIPITSMKDHEVYAPQYESGTKVALIRYPHGGTFEIPILTVNNKQKDAKNLLGTDIIDAVGINSKVAERLSGADFDGDTVMVIPTHDRNGRVKITSTPALEGLKGFDPKTSYPERPGMKYMKDPVSKTDNTQNEMGKISNLITDMTLKGASTDELARAVRHSMVVIDAGKHKLDYKRSEEENGIKALKKKYQGKETSGASTLISRSSGEKTVDRRQGSPIIDPITGKKTYKVADDLYYPVRKFDKESGKVIITTADGKKIAYDRTDKASVDMYTPVKRVDPNTGKVSYTDKTGTIAYKIKKRTQSSTNMAETDDARTLISDFNTPMERIYADYANTMKAMGNQARKEMMGTKEIAYSASAKTVYKAEVDSLKSHLNQALLNAPRERQAQLRANAEIAAKKLNNPDMKKEDIKKASQQALTKYRSEVGSVSRRNRAIQISDKEWEAIQAGAISKTMLKKILDNSDINELRDRAMPKTRTTLSKAKVDKIKAMSASNYTLNQIAEAMNISPSTVSNYLKGAN